MALKGLHVKAQGAALGKKTRGERVALKERNSEAGRPMPPFPGLRNLGRPIPQGCALGYRIPPFQGVYAR